MIFDFFREIMKKIDKEKITQSSAVNVEGYVLDAREKNPSISGTMAKQISELNTNIECVAKKAPTGQRYLSADSGVYVTNEKHTAFTDMTARDFYERASGYEYSLSNIGTRCVVLEKNMEGTSWQNIKSQNIKQAPIMYMKRAGIAFVECTGHPHVLVNKNTWTEVGKIPAGYRPSKDIPFVGFYGTIIFIGYVYTSGSVTVYSNTEISTVGNGMNFNVSYPVA